MVLFWPIQQELDCITDKGDILGKIRFDLAENKHIFTPANASVTLSNDEQTHIHNKLIGLDSGHSSIPMPDDD